MLENKSFEKISGASDAEKELKMQRIRKAIETSKKEQMLYKRKTMKRPGQLKKFGGKFYGNYAYGGHDGGAVPAY